MKKVFAYLILIIFTAVFFISASNSVMIKLAPFRYDWESPLGADNYINGDLYGFSYLPMFAVRKPKVILPPLLSQERKHIDFFCVCDSYIWSFKLRDSALYGVNKYYQVRWAHEGALVQNIDTTKTNVLLIEITERLVLKYLTDTSEIYSKLIIENFPHERGVIKPNETLLERVDRILANPLLERNLEFNLYDYRIFTPLKELKAQINYTLFERVNSDVVVSSDKKYLFYAPTVDTSSDISSFRYVSDEKILYTVNSLNTILDYYLKCGFDYVYLSIIPNPVSILDSKRMNYNNLITRIQNHPKLNIKYIDAYHLLTQEPQKVYEKSDSHWNGYGLNLWLNELNILLKSISN